MEVLLEIKRERHTVYLENCDCVLVITKPEVVVEKTENK